MVRQVNKDYQSPLMEAYIKEVRRLEEHFDGLQTEHVPRAENSIADHLSKCAAQKLPVEPGAFVLHLSQPYVSPSTMPWKSKKLDYGKPLPIEPSTPGRDPARNNSSHPAGPPPPVGPMDPANEAGAPTWARRIIHFLQTGELPGDPDEAEKVAWRASMYQFVN